MDKNLSENILQKYLDSYPCPQCNKFKRFDTEMNNVHRLSGGVKNTKELNKLMHKEYLKHIEDKHLPSKTEWEILKRS